MFNGIIEDIGTIISLSKKNDIVTYEIKTSFNTSDIKIGESIATSGVCLTVTKKTESTFFVQAMQETMNRTNFNKLESGSTVNLERSLKFGDRVSGHFAWGHVDTTTQIIKIENLGDSKRIHFSIPQEQKKFIDQKSIKLFPINIPNNNKATPNLEPITDFKKTTVEKGTITLNGVSLTISSVNNDKKTFTVDLIPETLKKTTFGNAEIGDIINLEVDMIARYAIMHNHESNE